MSFSVEPHALDGYAGQLGRAGDDAQATKNYLDGYTIPGGGDGALILLAGPSAVDALTATIDVTQKLSTVCHLSQAGLTEAANYYRSTDAAAAARLDGTLPGREPAPATPLEGEWAATGRTPTFTDAREPADRLKPVDDIKYSHPLAFLDTISLSHWALEGFDYVFGFNPLEQSLNFYVGDWQAFGKAGRAIRNTADALDDLALNVQGGAVALHPTWWQGHAGETAYQHFADLAQGVNGLVEPMREIATQFDTIGSSIYHSAESVSGLVKGMVDAAVIAGIAAAAGTASAITGIGAVFSFGVATLEVARMLQLWAQATALMTGVYSAAQAATGVIGSAVTRLYGANLPELTGGGYAHPLAAH